MPRPPGFWTYLELFFSGMEKLWSNTFWYDTGSTPIPPTDNPAEDFYVNWASSFAALMPPSNAIIGARATINDGTDTIGYEYYHSTPGTVTSSVSLPEDVSAVVQRIANHTGKSGRGRIFVSGLSETMSSGSYISTTGETKLTVIASLMMTPVSDAAGNTWTPQHYDRLTNSLYAIAFAFPTALLATSRRRRGRF